jgi:hypothetical protein
MHFSAREMNARIQPAPSDRLTAALARLHGLARECGEENWDGAGAKAASPAAVRTAEDLIRTLPPALPLPEISCDPDGAVSLDWIPSGTRILSLSAGPSASERLACAWFADDEHGHAVIAFDRVSFPAPILQGLRTIGLLERQAQC